MIENIVKRSGKTEPFDADKLNDLGAWAVQGTECSWPLLVTSAVKKLYEGCTSKELMKAMIDSANDMIPEDYDWQYVAAKLCVADIRKDVYASFTPVSLKEFYHEMTALGRWKEMDYTDEELDLLDQVVDHDKDENFTYSGIKQVLNKYLITDLTSGQLYETPQMLYMGVAMAGFESTQDKAQRLAEVSKFYQRASDWVINIPTPQLRSLRTNETGLASCCLIEAGDELDSINVSAAMAFKMTALGAGIGVALRSRSIGDSIRNGQVEHGGKLPYYRHYQTAVSANKQPGRGGSATVFYALFDPEIETLLKLKSDKVSEAVKIKHMDYTVQVNKYLVQRMQKGVITLLSYQDAPEVWDCFYGKDLNKFIRAYEAAEKRCTEAKRVDAKVLMSERALQSVETGRIYMMDVHETNRRSTFKDPVVMSNLCVAPETKVLTDKGDLPIKSLEGQTVNVWNGEEWSAVKVVKTGKNQELMRVVVEEVMQTYAYYGTLEPTYRTLWCTPYHKFYDVDKEEVPAHELSKGDTLESFVVPDPSGSTAGTIHLLRVVSVDDFGRRGDTYCFNEPKRHRAVFNGILTGQCEEVVQPTGPYKDFINLYSNTEQFYSDGRTSEVSLCTLAAYNIDLTADLSNEDLEEVCYLTVKYLDNLIDMQSYPFPNLEFTAKARRNLGIGLTNLAGALANRMLLWCSEGARTWTHEQMERISYYNHKASIRLAKERGRCEWFHRTTYSDGELPIDTYKPFVDTVHTANMNMDWEGLRQELIRHGMRHSVLEAQMPCESSSQATCSTNGVEPPIRAVTSKKTEQGVNRFVIPYAKEKEYFYQFAWDVNNKDHSSLMAVIQKFMGMSISANGYYNYANYPKQEIPMQELHRDMLWDMKLGKKTWYYTNTDTEEKEECEGCSV